MPNHNFKYRSDVGIAAGVGRAIIFRKGQKARVVEESAMLSALMEEIELVVADQQI
jgi:(E)-4-hydroxy-3-methylbut-2-enyl-diphosphate synthase